MRAFRFFSAGGAFFRPPWVTEAFSLWVCPVFFFWRGEWFPSSLKEGAVFCSVDGTWLLGE